MSAWIWMRTSICLVGGWRIIEGAACRISLPKRPEHERSGAGLACKHGARRHPNLEPFSATYFSLRPLRGESPCIAESMRLSKIVLTSKPFHPKAMIRTASGTPSPFTFAQFYPTPSSPWTPSKPHAKPINPGGAAAKDPRHV